MKRLLLAAAFAIAIPSSASAGTDTVASVDQSQVSGTWINGVKLGLTFSTMGGDVQDEAGQHTGTTLGYFFSYRLGNGLAVQPEIKITEKGAPSVILNETGRLADLTYTYIDIPVLGRYNLSVGNGIVPYAYAGPNFSINIDSSRLVSTSARDWDEETKNFDVGFAAGAGVDYLIKNDVGVTLDVRFAMGLLSTDATIDETSLTNRVFMVMLGIWK